MPENNTPTNNPTNFQAPPTNTGTSGSEIQFTQKQAQHVPAGFWRRFGAVIIDGLFIGIISMPVSFGFGLLQGATGLAVGQSGGQQNLALSLGIMGMSWIVNFAILFFVAGWFNKNKGGMPGKLLLNLRIVDAQTGEYISYGTTALREIVGKQIINLVTLGIGYLVALFNDEKKGLHDMVAGTRVIHLQE